MLLRQSLAKTQKSSLKTATLFLETLYTRQPAHLIRRRPARPRKMTL